MRAMFLLTAAALLLSFPSYAGAPATHYSAARHLLDGPVMDADSTPTLSLQQPVGEKKSPALAAVYSLLLPGMGEVYAGNFSSGKFFLIAEGALWLTFASFEVYGNALRDDARAYASSRAGVALQGKDDQYFIDIGNFLDINEYNEKQLRDREPEKLYDPAAGYAWSWESDGARAEYRTERIRSETMYNNKKFVVAAIIINHVASAINAARGAVAHNSDLSFRAEVLGGLARPHGMMVTVTKTF